MGSAVGGRLHNFELQPAGLESSVLRCGRRTARVLVLFREAQQMRAREYVCSFPRAPSVPGARVLYLIHFLPQSEEELC